MGGSRNASFAAAPATLLEEHQQTPGRLDPFDDRPAIGRSLPTAELAAHLTGGMHRGPGTMG